VVVTPLVWGAFAALENVMNLKNVLLVWSGRDAFNRMAHKGGQFLLKASSTHVVSHCDNFINEQGISVRLSR